MATTPIVNSEPCGCAESFPQLIPGRRSHAPECRNNPAVRLRRARALLKYAVCTCGGKHDPFWVKCERTVAQIALDDALDMFGIEP